MKLSADQNGSVRFLTAKLGKEEQFDPREMEVLWSGAVPGLILPAAAQGKILQYNVSTYATLEYQLSSPLTRELFATLLLQCVELLRQMQYAYLNPMNLVLDLNQVYVQMDNRTMHFVYLPIQNSKRAGSIPGFFQAMANRATRSTYELVSFLEACQNYLSRPNAFSLDEFDGMIRSLSGVGLYAQQPSPAQQQYAPAQQYIPDQQQYAPVQQPDPVQLYTPVQQPDPVLQQYAPAQQYIPDQQQYAPVQQPEPVPQQYAPVQQPDPVQLYTPVQQPAPGPQSPIPGVRFYLTRDRTGERIDLSCTPFLVGADPGSMTYCVRDNPAVSRRHALFAIDSDGCTVADLTSTNKTYLNGRMLEPHTPAQLMNGDRLRLANEDFTFHIEV